MRFGMPVIALLHLKTFDQQCHVHQYNKMLYTINSSSLQVSFYADDYFEYKFQIVSSALKAVDTIGNYSK